MRGFYTVANNGYRRDIFSNFKQFYKVFFSGIKYKCQHYIITVKKEGKNWYSQNSVQRSELQ